MLQDHFHFVRQLHEEASYFAIYIYFNFYYYYYNFFIISVLFMGEFDVCVCVDGEEVFSLGPKNK